MRLAPLVTAVCGTALLCACHAGTQASAPSSSSGDDVVGASTPASSSSSATQAPPDSASPAPSPTLSTTPSPSPRPSVGGALPSASSTIVVGASDTTKGQPKASNAVSVSLAP